MLDNGNGEQALAALWRQAVLPVVFRRARPFPSFSQDSVFRRQYELAMRADFLQLLIIDKCMFSLICQS